MLPTEIVTSRGPLTSSQVSLEDNAGVGIEAVSASVNTAQSLEGK